MSMNKTKIEWTNYSWNPVTGCLNECWYCYVRRLEERFGYSRLPRIHPVRFKAPFNAHEGAKIFVCSTADLFGPWIPKEWIDEVLSVTRKLPKITFQFLTKFPRRYLDFNFPENCWLGTTVESEDYLERAAFISEMRGNIRFISFEPLLSRIPEVSWLKDIDWMIIGAFTGDDRVKHQPRREWVYSLIDMANVTGRPVFMKNNLKDIWSGALRQEYPTMKIAKTIERFSNDRQFVEAKI